MSKCPRCKQPCEVTKLIVRPSDVEEWYTKCCGVKVTKRESTNGD